MSKVKKRVIGWALIYVALLEVLLYGSTNHWHINQFLLYNLTFVAIFGWIPLMVFTIIWSDL